MRQQVQDTEETVWAPEVLDIFSTFPVKTNKHSKCLQVEITNLQMFTTIQMFVKSAPPSTWQELINRSISLHVPFALEARFRFEADLLFEVVDAMNGRLADFQIPRKQNNETWGNISAKIYATTKFSLIGWLVEWYFLSVAIGQRPMNYLSCYSCPCCSPFGSFPH